MLKLEGKQADMLLSCLKNWQLIDGNGMEGDSLTLSLFSEGISGIPSKGEKYEVYLDDIHRDTFQISKRSAKLSPKEVCLVLSVAPFSVTDASGFRAKRSASWNKASIAEIMQDCLLPHGYSIFVHPKLQNIEIEHIDRTDEGCAAFLRRLAKQYDAIAKPVSETYVMAPKGEVISASGAAIETLTLSLPSNNDPQLPNFVNVDIELDGREEFGGVSAFYLSTDSGHRNEVNTGNAPFKALGKDFKSKEEAEQACFTELRRITREGRKVNIVAPANSVVFAEGLVVLDKTFDELYQGISSIDTVTFSGQGRQVKSMTIQATLTGA
ncbi:phage late control gene D protein [Aliivibrio wodanis]|uniref:Phage late control gene D protein n=1 Tax=Aliivibrio wodanis TaxID=80852 RepID=A0A090KJ13_9GAMM|nr:phage late control gene D protein [Aliivibrio wodanis]